jgi:hypothetical protein
VRGHLGTPQHRLRLGGVVEHLESGQALVQLAFAALAMMAVLAAIVDLGLLMVQRRFNQNAADAVALTVGRTLQNNIGVNASNQVYFPVTQATLQGEIDKVFGPGINEHTGFSSRTVGREVTLEYSTNGGTDWCYSEPTPVSLTATDPCGGIPTPSAATPFLTRITVSTTTTGFFTSFANAMGASGGPCYRPGSAPASGTTTCAQATVSVSGTLVPPQGVPIVPASVPDCWVQGRPVGGFYDLWGDNGVPCPGEPDTGAWKHLIDFSAHRDASGAIDRLWHGDGYREDQARPGTRDRSDVAYWIARNYGGTIALGNYLYTGDPGNATGCSATGFYGGGGSCSDPDGQYFFEDSKLVSRDGRNTAVCSSVYGGPGGDAIANLSMNIGCREVAVVGWGSPQVQSGPNWDTFTGGTPDRVRVDGFYVFRLYCRRNNPGSPCNQRVDVGNCNGASGICGRLVALPVNSQCPTCTSGPTVIANMVRLVG